MAQDIQAGPVTLLQIFKGEKEYVSPLFQRRYVWTDREINNLWKDIDGILEGEESTRFLGALVLEIKAAGLSFQPDSMWIVDGQQRLTTMYMVLLAIAKMCEQNAAPDLTESLFKQYLLNQDGEFKSTPKLRPTLLDYCQFNSLFKGIAFTDVKLKAPYGELNGSIERAFKTIEKSIKQRCSIDGKFSSEKTKSLVSTLLEKLKFVQIVLGENQDPHQVFDSLNGQGVRLESKDLIRNIVFQKVSENPPDAETVYHTKWLPLEQNLGEKFDDYFFPFALVHKPTVTKSTLLGALRQRWDSFTPTQIVDDLNVYVPTYNALTKRDQNLRDSLSNSPEVNDLISRLHRMAAPSSIFPYVFKIIEEFKNGGLFEEDATKSLHLIEAFLVRRAIAGFEPTGLHAFFKDLWPKTLGNPSKFIETVDANPTIDFPSDQKFEYDIKETPLYGRKLARYILSEYERGLSGGDPLPSDISLEDMTIDHVMPKEITQAWESVVNKDDHKKYKDTWANLTPLSLPANSEKGRKPWHEIREYFQTETLYKTTKRLAQLNEKWDIDSIKKRSEQLSLWALSRWPKQG